IVYAGAIVVTFLFVIMLAQAEGQATYDRAARAPARATLSCFLLLWGLAYALLHVRNPSDTGLARPEPAEVRFHPFPTLERRFEKHHPITPMLGRAVRPTARLTNAPHVAGLGGTLYTDHLIAVELAGALLFVALIGAAAIATPKPPIR